jgi:hypothetical protein
VQISTRLPHATAPWIAVVLVQAPDVIAVDHIRENTETMFRWEKLQLNHRSSFAGHAAILPRLIFAKRLIGRY